MLKSVTKVNRRHEDTKPTSVLSQPLPPLPTDLCVLVSGIHITLHGTRHASVPALGVRWRFSTTYASPTHAETSVSSSPNHPCHKLRIWVDKKFAVQPRLV